MTNNRYRYLLLTGFVAFLLSFLCLVGAIVVGALSLGGGVLPLWFTVLAACQTALALVGVACLVLYRLQRSRN